MHHEQRGEMQRVMVNALNATGAVPISAIIPGLTTLFRKFFGEKHGRNYWRNPKRQKKMLNTYSYLKRRGMIATRYKGKQMYISLTPEGKKLVRKYRIDDLVIKKQNNWDGKWRILIFDVPNTERAKREALRGKIKELGLFQLQKSVWVCPYHFKREMDILREFFDFRVGQMTVIVASQIENDSKLREFFRLD